jgi:hypothetical protein
MIRDPKFVRAIDNSNGMHRCRECSTPLVSVKMYESPGGRNSEIVGYCPNKKCLCHDESQSDG